PPRSIRLVSDPVPTNRTRTAATLASRTVSIPPAARQMRNRVALLITCGEPNLTRGTSVHPYDAEPDDQVRPDGLRRSGDKTRPDNSQVCRHIIARRKERGAGQAPGVRSNPRQHQRARQVDHEGTRASQG